MRKTSTLRENNKDSGSAFSPKFDVFARFDVIIVAELMVSAVCHSEHITSFRPVSAHFQTRRMARHQSSKTGIRPLSPRCPPTFSSGHRWPIRSLRGSEASPWAMPAERCSLLSWTCRPQRRSRAWRTMQISSYDFVFFLQRYAKSARQPSPMQFFSSPLHPHPIFISLCSNVLLS